MSSLVEVVTVIHAAPEIVFDLELDAEVHAASMAASGERAVTSTGRSALGPGDEATFTARHLGLRWELTSRITEFDRPHRFVDEQVRGPFRHMRHEHLFDRRNDGTTRMTDRMQFTAPFGPLGSLVARLALAPYLRRLLRIRAAHLQHLAEAM
jgi:ligand-binding SRPBCC domain-containing protein